MSDDDDSGGEVDRREQQNQRGGRGGRGGKSRAGAVGRGAGAGVASTSTEKSAPKQSRALASLQSVNNPGIGQSLMRVLLCSHLCRYHILSTASFISSAGELPVPLTSALVGNRKAATSASLTSSVAAPAAAASSAAPSSSSAVGAASSSALPLAGVGALGPADSQKKAKKRSEWALLKLSRESFERAKQVLEHEINKHIELGGDAYPSRATAVKWVEIAVKGLKGPDNRVHVIAPSDQESEKLRE